MRARRDERRFLNWAAPRLAIVAPGKHKQERASIQLLARASVHVRY